MYLFFTLDVTDADVRQLTRPAVPAKDACNETDAQRALRRSASCDAVAVGNQANGCEEEKTSAPIMS
jgi:hypothetical protein